MAESRRELLEFALHLAGAAEAEILPRYQRCVVDFKKDGTEVTEADRRAEAVIREMIGRKFPTHAILGEEFGETAAADESRQWVIDPLDGTTAFALGTPLFGTLIALLEEREPVVGVIHFPVLGETVYAARGLGCWFKRGANTPVRVRAGAGVPLREAVVSASGAHASDIQPADNDTAYNLTSVIRESRKFRFVGDCLQHALVCRGNIHAAIDTIMQPWDVAALVPCIEESGGVATTLSGQRENVVFGGSLLASCDQSLHEEVLDRMTSRQL